ncbi:NAD(P)-dependent oxidoreductase [Nocardioides sp. zg-DK7169]|uniref:NAD-dependent epimerase/dehydratase family protein n=1 Tax=Nocardioides sp. zg-DK7169 TaxID=2736600 RepID=UPI001556B259|nr:NAD(P)-dependent oxidoreductase [Nocardioides sp. zg-DK7169]NPC98626.1 NAD(P)-dependent oxidoreductase [Nocardioides sp. zg-DK7169]
MKTLVIGGAGMIGSHVATLLTARGHEVTVGGRSAPEPGSMVESLPFVVGDYGDGGFTEAELEGFDAVVFAAGQDVRHVGPEGGDEEFWSRYQSDGVPLLMQRAKKAGVRRAVQVGSYYHMVRPDLIDTNPYVRARQLADDRSRELADADFNVSTLNPPSIVGMIPGVAVRRFAKQLAWGRGELTAKVPDHAPAGGTNYMSVRSLAEAVGGALERAEPGAAYLIGDVNLSYRDYFQIIFDLSGGGRVLEERDEPHPFLPDSMIVPGRGAVIAYEPDPQVVALLGYRCDDVRPMLAEMAAAVESGAGNAAR